MSMASTDVTAGAWTAPSSLRELRKEGRSHRELIPRRSLGTLTNGPRDPLGILAAQNATRVGELTPIRAERMAETPFAFYRGTAAIMAADLAACPGTDLTVASCGDAHVSNFGLYASPQRTLVFDLNDFDEAAWAPWEWDLKRLVTSIVVAGQASARDDRVVAASALSAVRTYAKALGEGVARSPLERYFERFDIRDDSARGTPWEAAVRAAVRAAEKRTGDRAAGRLTTIGDDGRASFVADPPLMTGVDEAIRQRVDEVYTAYLASANVDIRVLLHHYAVADVARRVVGVGSVGTRCFLIALQDGDEHVLLLQAKEAGDSVLTDYGRVAQPEAVARHVARFRGGGRVVAMQRILQAVSDPFLGHLHGTPVEGGADRAFYVRQFHDKKGGFDLETLEDAAFRRYADACATTLARAHGQSPNAGVVAGYIGGGSTVATAIVEWSYAYAARSRADWRLFRDSPAADPSHTPGRGPGHAPGPKE